MSDSEKEESVCDKAVPPTEVEEEEPPKKKRLTSGERKAKKRGIFEHRESYIEVVTADPEV